MTLKIDPSVLAYMAHIKYPPAHTPFEAPDIDALRKASANTDNAVQTKEISKIENRHTQGPYGDIPLRIFTPLGLPSDQLASAIYYVHGGGWVIGGLDDFAPVCHYLAEHSGSIVVALDYRLAPEFKFPIAHEEVVFVWEWLLDHAVSLGIDPAHISIAGDSAGANMATACALVAKRNGTKMPRSQILFYPVTDLANEALSYTRADGQTPFTQEEMRWYVTQYMSSRQEALDWRASPLRAPDLSGLPPTFIVTVGHDPLSDEGSLYAKRMQNEGVLVTHLHCSGLIHGFLRMARIIHLAAPIMQFAAQFSKSINDA